MPLRETRKKRFAPRILCFPHSCRQSFGFLSLRRRRQGCAPESGKMLSGAHPAAVSGLRPFIPDKKRENSKFREKYIVFQ